MKVGFVLDDTLDSADGVQQYVISLGRWLAREGHAVHYLVGKTKRKDLPHIHSLSSNVAVRFNRNRLSIPLPASKSRIRALLGKEQFDVLHVQMPYSPMLASRVIAAAPSTTAIVGTFHIAPFSRFETVATSLLGRWLKSSLRHFDQVLSVSPTAQAFAKKTFKLDSQVLPNVVDVASFRVATPHVFKRPAIVFVGRLVPRKGALALLRAVDALKTTYPGADFEVHICGGGPLMKQLRAYVGNHDLADTVQFHGFITEEFKKQALRGVSIATFPSLGGESFGIVLLEAMAAGGGVVVAGDNPGYRTVLGPVKGSLLDPNNTKLFADKLHDLLVDAPKHQALYSQQQELVKQFDIAVVGPKLIHVYKQAIAKSRQA